MSVTTIITAIIEALTQFVAGFATALVSTAQALFFTDEGALSALGIVLMVAVGLGMADWLIDKVISLFRLKRE